jgi:hypothetical protein
MYAKNIVLKNFVIEFHSLTKGIGMVGESVKNISMLFLKTILKMLRLVATPPKLLKEKGPGLPMEEVESPPNEFYW